MVKTIDLNSSFQKTKALLDNEYEVCAFTTGDTNLRKHVWRLMDVYKYKIYRNHCDCGLTNRKHFSYEKDWASDYS